MEKQKNFKKVLTKDKKTIIIYKCQEENYCRCSSMVEPQPSKLMTWVRFPLPAPYHNNLRTKQLVSCFLYLKTKYSLSRKEDIFYTKNQNKINNLHQNS